MNATGSLLNLTATRASLAKTLTFNVSLSYLLWHNRLVRNWIAKNKKCFQISS